ncbi:cation diffusion facilitator family transporter [Candidatus Saccharibacteria bacterium]|nr:cation diffusion facilitator family transporter [Candidatus Saccharibacteria bacterium]MBR3253561.1 cation diffusion facilitator family transporter [Candidatus Saccharibacteria bacterium]
MEKNRSKTIIRAGRLFIVINILLSFFNIIIGVLSNSLAIISDAIHSFTDSISGLLIIVSEKLATKDKYSHYRNKIERITTIIIASIIVVIGIHIIIESIEGIINPEKIGFSIATIIVIVASIFTKYLLARFLKNKGKTIKSNVLVASGAETMNDAWISVAVLVSTIIYMIWQINIEPYLSIIIAIIIMKIGLEFIFPHFFRHHHHHLESDKDHDHCGKKNGAANRV